MATRVRAMAADVTLAAGPQEVEEFLRLPWRIYKGDPNWVPPILDQQRTLLAPARHPFHQHGEMRLFLARRGGEVVGRIAAIVNRQHNRYHDDAAGFFGFFECVDDRAVAKGLLDAAAAWVSQQGLQCLRGPVNPSTNEECGLLIEGFDRPPVFMMPYNPAYYPGLVEACGFEKAKDLHSYYIDRELIDPERAGKVGSLVDRVRQRSGVAVRQPDMRRFSEEAAIIKSVYNRAWSENWGFVPMTDPEFDHLAEQLKQLIVPRLARIGTVRGEPAGFALVLPDYNEPMRKINGRMWPFGLPYVALSYHLRRIRGIRLFALGVVKEHQKKGLEAAMLHDLYEAAAASHYRWCDLGWTLEDNDAVNNVIRSWGGRLYKRYRIFERAISEGSMP